MTHSPCQVLLIDLEGLALPWPGLEAVPFAHGLLPQAAWTAWPSPEQGAGHAFYAALWPGLVQVEASVGLFNLPGPWPPPGLGGWWVGRLSQAAQGDNCTWPRELAQDLGDYLAGQRAVLAEPAPRPHQRDQDFALWACLARLVWEHAQRLLAAGPPALAGVGFQGLAQVADLFADDPARLGLFLAQVNHYIAQLAGLLQPRFLLLLGGQAGYLAWAPGQPWPGPMQAPAGLAALALGLLERA